MRVEKWWNEIGGWGKREKPRENLPRPRFVHHETHMEGPRRELGTPAVGGERLTACATRPPNRISFDHHNHPYHIRLVRINESEWCVSSLMFVLSRR